MLDVYVCEDEGRQLKQLERYIKNTILIEELDMEVACSSTDPTEILDVASKSEHNGVYFLDIDLHTEMNGMVLAQELRKIQPRCFIIFITSHSEMSYMTFQYKVEALDFIVKDTCENVQKRIHECLLNVNEKYLAMGSKRKKTLVVRQGERRIPVEYDEILFLETTENIHRIALHAKKRLIEFSGQLKDVEAQLDERFYRCHRSCIVNIDNVTEVDFQKLTMRMVNGERCLISARAKPGLKKLIL